MDKQGKKKKMFNRKPRCLFSGKIIDRNTEAVRIEFIVQMARKLGYAISNTPIASYIMFVGIFLLMLTSITLVSAKDYQISKEYNYNEDIAYFRDIEKNKVTAQIDLIKSGNVMRGRDRRVLIWNITNFDANKFSIDDLEFKNMYLDKFVNKTYYYQYLDYGYRLKFNEYLNCDSQNKFINNSNYSVPVNCTEIKEPYFEKYDLWRNFTNRDITKQESLIIALVTDVKPHDYYDGIPIMNIENKNIKVVEQAEWTESLTNGLELYLSFDEVINNQTTDIYTGKHNATFVLGSQHRVDGKIGNATNCTVQSTSSRIGSAWNVANPLGLFNVSKNFTLSFWHKKNNDFNNKVIMSAGANRSTLTTNPQFNTMVWDNGGNKLTYWGHDSVGGIQRTYRDSNYGVQGWTHIVIRKEGISSSALSIFVNGTEVVYGSGTSTAVEDGAEYNNFTICSADGFYSGSQVIDEVAKYNRALSDQEVSDLFNGGLGLQYVPLVQIPPNVTIISPLNQTYGTEYLMFNITAEHSDIDTCLFTINDYNQNFSFNNDSSSNFYYLNNSVSSGSFEYKIFCNGTDGGINDTESINFSIDVDSPLINIISPTTINYTRINISTNVSGNEVLSDCYYSINNFSTNNTMFKFNDTYFNQTVEFSEGINNVSIYCNDSYNNYNNTEFVTFRIDVTPPYFTNFVNQTITYNESFSFDLDAVDTYSQLDSFIVNDTVNFKINRTTGLLENNTALSINIYYINISLNDSNGFLTSNIMRINSSFEIVYTQEQLNEKLFSDIDMTSGMSIAVIIILVIIAILCIVIGFVIGGAIIFIIIGFVFVITTFSTLFGVIFIFIGVAVAFIK